MTFSGVQGGNSHHLDSPRVVLVTASSPTVIGFDHRYRFYFFISALTKGFSFNWEKYGQVTIDSLEINCGSPLMLVFASTLFFFLIIYRTIFTKNVELITNQKSVV